MARSANAKETVTLSLRVAVGSRARLAELMGRELGTGLTMSQTLEMAVMEALVRRRGPDAAGAGEYVRPGAS